MLKLEKYGRVIREYEGNGNLMLEGEILTDCTFQMVQYVTGNILLHGYINHGGDHVNLPVEKVDLGRRLDFDGQTSDSARLHFVGAMILGDTEHMSTVDGFSRELWLSAQSATIEYAQAPKNGFVRFSLVNLELHGAQLSLQVGAQSIQLIPLDDSNLTVEILKVTKGIDLTSHALATFDDSVPVSAIFEAVSDTCLLLSLIRGTRVNWLNYDILSPDGSITETHCCDRVTKRFGYASLIHPIDQRETKIFIESTFGNLHGAEGTWDIVRVVDAYIDGKVEGDFLESRGLKIAVCLEMMRARYLLRESKTNLISEREFSRNVEALKTSIKSLLMQILPSFAGELNDAKTSLLLKMTKNAHGMNNYPFRDALQEMCQIVHFAVSPGDLKRIVAIRNNLVHEGRYKPGLGTPYEQYKLLSDFVGCFLMSALGSQNWTTGIEWIIAPDSDEAHSRIT